MAQLSAAHSRLFEFGKENAMHSIPCYSIPVLPPTPLCQAHCAFVLSARLGYLGSVVQTHRRTDRDREV